ncbi:MAG TPA: hypothetical protein VM100_07630, partial [Longimicrobiales bacterium]|nr:hypothetical protein [Longimicrobiales bacterium]
MTLMRSGVLYALLLCMLAGCELKEVTIAESDDVVIAELILRTDTRQQRILLHRTIKSDSSSTAVP